MISRDNERKIAIMEDYKPNSHRYKEAQKRAAAEDKKVEKVVAGTVKVKKKNEIGRLKDVFISEDVNNVKNYVLMDVLIPAVKKAISDIVTNGTDMILYGSTGNKNRSTNASYVSYRDYSGRSSGDRFAASNRRPATASYGYNDIFLDNRGEAEEVLSRMDELLDTYGVVSVADLYDLVGVTGSFTDNKYGWMSLASAKVVPVRGGGYMLKLPTARPLD